MAQNEFRSGWKILLACFLGVGVSLPSLYVYTAGIWIIDWQAEFGWSRAEIGLGQSLIYLVLVLGTPVTGMLIDRFGFRKMGVLSLLLYGSCFYLYSQMNGSLLVFYLLSVLITLTALPSTPIGFTKSINQWFDVNRGLSLGITLSAIGIGAIIAPKFLTIYVASHGWRAGQVVLFLTVLVVAPLVWFLLKEPSKNSDPKAVKAVNGMTLKEAIKTPVFWKIGSVLLLVSAALLGLIPNFIPMLQDEGLSAEKAGELMAVLGLSVVIGRILIGFLIDRFFAAYIAIIFFTLAASGCFLLGLGQTKFVYWGAMSIGLAVGAEVDLVSYFSVRYFGLKHYGSIFGTLYSLFVCGAILSPLLVGYSWDVTGNYTIAFYSATGILTLALFITWFLPRFPIDPVQ